MVDCIRRRFYTEPGVVYHYSQNMVLFADQEWLAPHPEVAATDDPLPSRVVHPDLFPPTRRAATIAWHGTPRTAQGCSQHSSHAFTFRFSAQNLSRLAVPG